MGGLAVFIIGSTRQRPERSEGARENSEEIQAVLHDAEEREIRDEAVKLWLKELKGVAYDAEDVLDEYHYEELRAEAEAPASRKRKRVEGYDEEEQENLISELRQLTIWSCMDIPPIGYLPGLRFLQALVMKDRPAIQLLSNEMLPSTLRSLEVDSCENLKSVRLVDFLTSLETLVIRDRPGIQLLPNKMLPSTLRSLEVDSCENLRSVRLGGHEGRYALENRMKERRQVRMQRLRISCAMSDPQEIITGKHSVGNGRTEKILDAKRKARRHYGFFIRDYSKNRNA
ncbi:hypothetical protein COCNU_16G000610 [Cocos nucifera]|uniref:Disease resistance N-terminal domain-containing protein n=1 Tax=Cocos nucifera TaxID=13894 RepID=A0A8K0IXX3_COCNU|nr:hypothetical protein COCNU_16G000610 [Cocos nucifera]